MSPKVVKTSSKKLSQSVFHFYFFTLFQQFLDGVLADPATGPPLPIDLLENQDIVSKVEQNDKMHHLAGKKWHPKLL